MSNKKKDKDSFFRRKRAVWRFWRKNEKIFPRFDVFQKLKDWLDSVDLINHSKFLFSQTQTSQANKRNSYF